MEAIANSEHDHPGPEGDKHYVDITRADAVDAVKRIADLIVERDKLFEALLQYADPESYHAVAMLVDRPAGWFADDFDGGHEGYDRPMPGKHAREVVGWGKEEQKGGITK